MQIQFGYTKFMSHAFYVPSRAPVIRNEVLLACVSSAMARDKADRAIPDLYVALFVAHVCYVVHLGGPSRGPALHLSQWSITIAHAVRDPSMLGLGPH